MSDFSTTARLEVELDQGSLRNVKQELEDEVQLPPLQAELESGGGRPGSTSQRAATDGGSGGRERRMRRREFRWARQRTNDIDEIVDLLYSIDGDLGEGGGGILDSLLGLGGGAAAGGALGGLGGAGGMLGMGLATAVGSAVGSAVGDAVTGTSVDLEEPGWAPLEADQPEPISIEIDDPSPLDVDDSEPLGVDPPGDIPVDAPSALDVNAPTSIPVDDPSPLDVEDVPPVNVQVAVTGSRAGDGELPEDIPEVREAPDGVREWAERGSEEWGDDVPVVGHGLGGVFGGIAGALDPVLPGESAYDREERLTRRERRDSLLEEAARGGGGVSVGVTAASTPPPTVEQINVDQTFDVEVIVDQIRDVSSAVSSLEREIDSAFDDLERELSDLESRVESLEDAF